MTLQEALNVAQKHEVPHRYIDTGQAKELLPALRDAVEVLAAEVDRLTAELEGNIQLGNQAREELTAVRAELAKCERDYNTQVVERLAEQSVAGHTVEALEAENAALRDGGHGVSNMELELGRMRAENATLRAELETERMRLTACSIAAGMNTREIAAHHRIGPDNKYYSASYADVCRAVDREMDLRDELAQRREAVRALYYAAHWYPDRDVDAAELWTRVRDVFGFAPGSSPKPLGPSPYEMREAWDRLIEWREGWLSAVSLEAYDDLAARMTALATWERQEPR